ncbi:MAG: heat-inducible transcriptional repressor HrcA [Clostridiales Family XIII bacterium]|jgi:transcriptional regulator of heat shock response|nr:heat-inducible transcriptional repressor HrcA [Clostridiales Family XIII bacterium]
MMELTERKLKILQAIISDFIVNAEPVGSRTLAYRLDMGLSPATIRNEMADLEEMGYLYHPHTSSGRVPTDRAYRLYVNRLMDKYELDQAEKLRIRKALRGNIRELEKTVRHASELLSELTNLTSFATLEEDMRDMSLFLQGMTRIFAHPEYSTIEQARSFLEMLDDREPLTTALAERPEGLSVTIGDENSSNIAPGSSIITATYHVDGHLVGKLGVIGPTRMRYGKVASVIEYMSDNLERTFKMIDDGKESGENGEDEEGRG